jgi:hypothetical protein
MIRRDLDENFSGGVAWFLPKNCTEGQEDEKGKRSKEAMM